MTITWRDLLTPIKKLLCGLRCRGPKPPVSPVLARPTITGASKEIGVVLTRIIGTYAAGWTPTAGLWTVVSSGTIIGNQGTQTTGMVPAGGFVRYRETISKPGEADQFADSDPYGPFVVGAAAAPSDDEFFDEMMLLSTNTVDARSGSPHRWWKPGTGDEGNEGLMEGIGYLNSGWRNGPDLGFGFIFRRLESPNTWIAATRDRRNKGHNDHFWSNYLDPWMVFCHEASQSGGLGVLDVRRLSCQIWWDNNTWTWAFKDKYQIGWAPDWRMGLMYGQGYPVVDPHPGDRPVTIDHANRISTISIAPGVDSTGAGYASHFSFKDAQFTYVDATKVRGMIVSAEVRRNPASSPAHQGLLHLGLDPKPMVNAGDSGDWWEGGAFPNACISRTIKVDSAWRRIYASTIQRPGSSSARYTPLATMIANRPLNPWV